MACSVFLQFISQDSQNRALLGFSSSPLTNSDIFIVLMNVKKSLKKIFAKKGVTYSKCRVWGILAKIQHEDFLG